MKMLIIDFIKISIIGFISGAVCGRVAAIWLSICQQRRHLNSRQAVRVIFTISVHEKKQNERKNNMPPTQITTEQQINLAAAFETASGKPATIVGVPAWASSDPTIVTVQAAPDGLSALVVSVAPGLATVTVTGEGDTTPGVDTVKGSVDVNVVAPEASQVVLTVGTPTLKS